MRQQGARQQGRHLRQTDSYTFFACIRWTVFGINLFCWLFGLVILGVGLWLRFDKNITAFVEISHDYMNHFRVGAYLLIAGGGIISFLGLFGCCGAWRVSSGMLTIFFLLLFIVIGIEFACAVLAYLYQDNISSHLERALLDTIMNSYGSQKFPRVTAYVDSVQTSLECCGVRSFNDWFQSSFAAVDSPGSVPELGIGRYESGPLPHSCCTAAGVEKWRDECGVEFGTLLVRDYRDYIHHRGCSGALSEQLSRYNGTIIGFAVFVCVVQMLSMIATICMCMGQQQLQSEGYMAVKA